MYVMTMDRDETLDEIMVNLTGLVSTPGLVAFLNFYMGPQLQKRARERFANEGDDAVGKWLPLASVTTESFRPQQGYAPGPINHRSGELEAWVTNSGWDTIPTGGGATMLFPGRNPTGELAKKVTTAQSGSTDPYTPARPVLAVSTRDLAIFAAGFAVAITEGVRL